MFCKMKQHSQEEFGMIIPDDTSNNIENVPMTIEFITAELAKPQEKQPGGATGEQQKI